MKYQGRPLELLTTNFGSSIERLIRSKDGLYVLSAKTSLSAYQQKNLNELNVKIVQIAEGTTG